MVPAHKKQHAKGQMIFEFAVAALLFFGIMFLIITYLNQNVRSFSSDAYREVLQSKAFQISDMLVKNRPVWPDQYDLRVIGLEKDWPVLDAEKITWLQNYCTWTTGGEETGYKNLRTMFGLDEQMYDFDTGEHRQFNITIINIEAPEDSRVLLSCGKEPGGVRQAFIRRVAVSETREILTIDVSVW